MPPFAYLDKNSDRIIYIPRNERTSQGYLEGKDNQDYIEIMEAVVAYKGRIGCARCSEMDPNVLTFHHRDENDKMACIETLARRTRDLDLVIQEMQKCDVLCRVCHDRLHNGNKHNARHSYRTWRHRVGYATRCKVQHTDTRQER